MFHHTCNHCGECDVGVAHQLIAQSAWWALIISLHDPTSILGRLIKKFVYKLSGLVVTENEAYPSTHCSAATSMASRGIIW